MRAYQPTLDFHRLIALGLPDEDGQDWADANRGCVVTTSPTLPSSRVIRI